MKFPKFGKNLQDNPFLKKNNFLKIFSIKKYGNINNYIANII